MTTSENGCRRTAWTAACTLAVHRVGLVDPRAIEAIAGWTPAKSALDHSVTPYAR